MTETPLATTYALSGMAGFTGVLIAVFEMDVLSQTEINALGALLIAGGAIGIIGSLLIEYGQRPKADKGVTVDER